MSKTTNGSVALFVAVDMFTGYIQLKALKSRKAEELIEAVRSTIIVPFGIPKFFLCTIQRREIRLIYARASPLVAKFCTKTKRTSPLATKFCTKTKTKRTSF